MDSRPHKPRHRSQFSSRAHTDRLGWLADGNVRVTPICPDKTEVARGMDFFELAEDGRIRRVTGFFGAPPAIKP
ncbi:MAG TPA: hypothetical protein VF461_24525 [Gemmatimonadaceae bacterium]